MPSVLIVLAPSLLFQLTTASCANSPVDLDMDQKFQRASIVLYGTDVTPKENCTESDTAFCGRRQIQFSVKCILKNMPKATITAAITIGTRPDPEECDGTYFAYDSRNEDYVVMLKYDSTNQQFDWDEVVPGKSAAFLYDTEVEEALNATCDWDKWQPPAGGNATSCPTQANTAACPGM